MSYKITIVVSTFCSIIPIEPQYIPYYHIVASIFFSIIPHQDEPRPTNMGCSLQILGVQSLGGLKQFKMESVTRYGPHILQPKVHIQVIYRVSSKKATIIIHHTKY